MQIGQPVRFRRRVQKYGQTIDRENPVYTTQTLIKHGSDLKEWDLWALYSGLDPQAGMSVSRTGIYSDFT